MSKASNDASPGIKSMLVAVDGSANSKRAADRAISIAKRLGAELYIVTAITIPVLATGAMAPSLETYFDSMEKDGKALLEGLAAQSRKEGVKTATAVLDNVTSAVLAITSYADEKHVDMIVVGSRGMGGFKRLLLGSVSSGVLNHAHCSVMVVR